MNPHVSPISLEQSDQILKTQQVARDKIGVMDGPVSRSPNAAARGDMHNPVNVQDPNTSH
jgi:hypothetical protein